jgi:mannosyltransferase
MTSSSIPATESVEPRPVVSTVSLPREAVRIATFAVVAIGILLRIYTYLYQSSLWIDEVAVVRNFLDRSVWQILTLPLDFGQVVPKGFLLFEKANVALFGTSALALRWPIAFASIASVILYWRVAQKLAGDAAALVATAMVALGPVLLEETAQVKSYSSDFAFSLLLLLIGFDVLERSPSRRRAILYAIAGAIMFFCSQHAILTGAAVGAALVAIAMHRRDRSSARPLAIILGTWGLFAAAAAALSVRGLTRALSAYMQRFWGVGFMKWGPEKFENQPLPWTWIQIQRVFIKWAGRQWEPNTIIPVVYALLALAGGVVLWRRNRERAALVLSCFAVAVVLSSTRQYPLAPFKGMRLLFFESSMIIVCAAAALTAFVAWLGRFQPRMAIVAGLLLSILFIAPTAQTVVKYPPPYKRDLAAEALAYVRAHRQPGDVVYAGQGIALAVMYHAPEYGFTRDEIVCGACSLEPRVWLREMDRLRGHRVWVITHNGRDQAKLLDAYLETIGRRDDSVQIDARGSWNSALAPRPVETNDPPTCAVYDLRDPALLARSTAARFKIPKKMKFYAEKWWCFGVFEPLMRDSGLPGGTFGP